MKVLITAMALAVLLTASFCHHTTEPPEWLPAPEMHPMSGTYSPEELIVITSPREDVRICYTTDTTVPDESSPVYSQPFTIADAINPWTNELTVRAICARHGMHQSNEAVAVYKVEYAETVAEVSASVAAGSIGFGSEISLSCPTPEARIYYTLDGSEPGLKATLYTHPIQMNTAGYITLHARAFYQGWNPSEGIIREYTVVLAPPEMIGIEGGTFNNGTSEVTVTGFTMDKYEVSQAHYNAVMNSWLLLRGDTPIYYTSWYDAIVYCNLRSMLEGLQPCYSFNDKGRDPAKWPSLGKDDDFDELLVWCDWNATGYRLPTEMEWEFAARGGNLSHGYTFSGADSLNWVGWYDQNSGSTVHQVGRLLPNELGLYDMSGNLWEWCWDFYAPYPSADQLNPRGPLTGSKRVIRGGSWYSSAATCSVSARNSSNPFILTSASIGFRCCKKL